MCSLLVGLIIYQVIAMPITPIRELKSEDVSLLQLNNMTIAKFFIEIRLNNENLIIDWTETRLCKVKFIPVISTRKMFLGQRFNELKAIRVYYPPTQDPKHDTENFSKLSGISTEEYNHFLRTL